MMHLLRVDINSTFFFFRTNHCFPKQTKQISEKSGAVLHFANFFNVWLHQIQLDSSLRFASNLSRCVLLLKVCEENPATQGREVGRRKQDCNSLFLENCDRVL